MKTTQCHCQKDCVEPCLVDWKHDEDCNPKNEGWKKEFKERFVKEVTEDYSIVVANTEEIMQFIELQLVKRGAK